MTEKKFFCHKVFLYSFNHMRHSGLQMYILVKSTIQCHHASLILHHIKVSFFISFLLSRTLYLHILDSVIICSHVFCHFATQIMKLISLFNTILVLQLHTYSFTYTVCIHIALMEQCFLLSLKIQENHCTFQDCFFTYFKGLLILKSCRTTVFR